MAAISLNVQAPSLNDYVFALLDYSWYAQPILRHPMPSSVPVVETLSSAGGQSTRISKASEANVKSQRVFNMDECSTSHAIIRGTHRRERQCTISDSEMRAVFDKFDHNGDGLISGEELRRYMKCCGADLSDVDAMKMISSVDLNKDGSVDFEEFLSLYEAEESGGPIGEEDEGARMEDEEAALLGAFRVFDRNHDGFITAHELQAVLLSLGMAEGKSLINCERMIREVDRDGDGQCDIQEFQGMMSAL